MQILKPPVYKWRYSFGGNHWYMMEKAPKILHRFMQRIVLGITWEEEKQTNNLSQEDK